MHEIVFELVEDGAARHVRPGGINPARTSRTYPPGPVHIRVHRMAAKAAYKLSTVTVAFVRVAAHRERS